MQKNQNANSKKIRIMVFDFHSKMMIEVVKALRARSIEIAYWTAGKKDFVDDALARKDIFPHTIFHDANDAAAGIGADGIDASSFEPLGDAFVKQFFECESRSLLMMESIDRTTVPFMKKMHLYHIYLKYWHGVLASLKPDAIIFNDIPHMSFKYIVYCIAKHLGIQQVMIRNTQIGGRMLLVDDITDFRKLRARIDENRSKNFTLKDLSLDVRDYYEKQKAFDVSPFYARKDNIKKRTYGLFQFLPQIQTIKKNIKNCMFFKTTYLYIRMLFMKRDVPSLERIHPPAWAIKLQERRWQKIKNEFKEEYKRYETKPDFSKKYVYVPLQRQQERSTLSDGGIFVDQILMIDILSHIIPNDWVIYVKESPLQWSMPRSHTGRFKGYTEEIIKKNNVRVVPIETGTFDLIRNSKAVALVTGTAALEAVLRGKPALVFGYSWFAECDGVFQVHDTESGKRALEKISEGTVPDQQKIINFLKAFDEVAIRGYRDGRFRDGDDLNVTFIKNDAENAKSVAEGLYEELASGSENAR